MNKGVWAFLALVLLAGAAAAAGETAFFQQAPTGLLFSFMGLPGVQRATLLMNGIPVTATQLAGQNRVIVETSRVQPIQDQVTATLSLEFKDGGPLTKLILNAPTKTSGEIQGLSFIFFPKPTEKTIKGVIFNLKSRTGQSKQLTEKDTEFVKVAASQVTVNLASPTKSTVIGTGTDLDVSLQVNYKEGGFSLTQFGFREDFSPVVVGPSLSEGAGQVPPILVVDPDTGEVTQVVVPNEGQTALDDPHACKAVKGSAWVELIQACGCFDRATSKTLKACDNPDGTRECKPSCGPVEAAAEAVADALPKPAEPKEGVGRAPVAVPRLDLGGGEKAAPVTTTFSLLVKGKPVVFKGQQQKIVVESSDGQPIDNAKLSVVLPDGKEQTLYTDSDGKALFLVDNIGKYRVVARKGDVEVKLDFQSYETVTQVPVISPTMYELYQSTVEEFNWVAVIAVVVLSAVAALTFYTYANLAFPDYGVERNLLGRKAIYFFTFLFLASPLIFGYFFRLGTGIILGVIEILLAYVFFNHVEPLMHLNKQEKVAAE